MTKYIGENTQSDNKTVYHTNPECTMLKSDPREVRAGEVEYHEMGLCSRCRKWERRSTDFSAGPIPEVSE